MAKSYPQVDATKRPSINDVALAAGVSRSAVSKVLRDAYGVSPIMRAKVEAAIHKLGYRPRTGARAMRGQTHLIGVAIPQLTNTFFSQIITGIQKRLDGTDYNMVVTPPTHNMELRQAMLALVDHQVDGIIAIAPEVSPVDLNQIAIHTPLVMIGRHDKTYSYDTVVGDDYAGTNQVVDHLIAMGHKRICHLTIRPTYDQEDARQPHTLRCEAFEKRMTAAGLEQQLALCAGAEETDAYNATLDLLAKPNRPTAIFAGNDTLAIGALRALAEQGISSDQMAVVGYDDIDVASHPMISLSTVSQFGEQLGKKAVDLLLERIEDNRDAPHQLQITPALKIRGTSNKTFK